MPITDFLERNAREYGKDIALVELNPEQPIKKRYTWKDYSLIESSHTSYYRTELSWLTFNEEANRVANFLLNRSVKRDSKVAILMMNCIEWLPIYMGILKSGALAVPFNFRYSAEEIKYCLELADVSILFFGSSFIGRMESIVDALPEELNLIYVGDSAPGFSESYIDTVGKSSPATVDIALKDEDDAAIYFSSGTTGFPKAILHTHKSLMTAAITEQHHHETVKEDCFLCIPPLYHTGAKMHWFGSLVSGSKAVLLLGTKPRDIFEAVSKEGCSIVWLLVPWAQDILDALDSKSLSLEDYDLNHWRLMHIGAQPVPPSLIKRWLKYFPHHKYDTNYGLSESIGPGCVHLGMENIHKIGAIGIPGYNWECKIVNDKGETLPRGEAGELAVRGGGVMKCYYKNPKATAEVLTLDGFLLTGDVAVEDSDGFIFLVDRKKDVIVSGGENLYPVQIEDFLRKCDKIKDVAVIGFPDERLGEIAGAIIELKEGEKMTEADIMEFCQDLPRYKRPKKIIFDKVPRNPTGKIEKPLLRKRYGADKLIERENKS